MSSPVAADGDDEGSRLRARVHAQRSADLAAVLTALCAVAVEELRLWGAVVSLMTPLETEWGQCGAIVAASSDRARFVEDLEFRLGEGPGNDAFLSTRPVLTPDLDRASSRWPGYAPAAVAAGARASFAFPMHVGAARFGVLHLHCSHTRTLTDREIATSLMLTELATETVLDDFPPMVGGGISLELGASDRRDDVYQAQGMVMVELGISLTEALARMRAHAFAADQDLADLAADILARRISLPHDRDVAP
jgi:hypothetical protein